jgi:hypothetical protein
LQKTDIFRRIMWFGFREDNTWYPLNVVRVNEILLMNREGKKPVSLQENQVAEKEPVSVLNSDLESLDKKFKNKSNKKRRKGGRNHDHRNPNQHNPNSPRNR